MKLQKNKKNKWDGFEERQDGEAAYKAVLI